MNVEITQESRDATVKVQRSTTRYCDYCGGKGGVCLGADNDRDVDICLSCVKLFNERFVHPEEQRLNGQHEFMPSFNMPLMRHIEVTTTHRSSSDEDDLSHLSVNL